MATPPMFDPDLYPSGSQFDADGSAVAWSAIWAGSATNAASSVLLLTLGSGLGLLDGSAWPGLRPSATSFAIGAGLWLIATQWISAGLGGYIAGRLRVRWPGLHNDEVFFRDTAHGFLTWATALVIAGAISVINLALTVPDLAQVADASPEMVEQMRKAAAAFALFTAMSMLVGAFVASVAAAIGGRMRDKHP